MSTDKFKSDNFIARFIEQDLTAEEIVELKNWIIENPEEGTFFQDIESAWNDSKRLEVRKGRSDEERWAQLSESISGGGRNKAMTPWKIVAVAASIILIATVTFLMNRPRIVEVFTPQGAQALEIFLPDSSKITLNADSRISYNKRDWHKSRDVSLIGEGFFEVRKSDVPFKVSTALSEVRVLGTSFNIKERNNSVTVFCATGIVEVSEMDGNNAGVTLTKGLTTSRKKSGNLVAPTQVGDAWKLTSWTKGEFHFSSTPLREVVDEVERQFDVEITLPSNFEEVLFNGLFGRGDLEKALTIIGLSSGLAFDQQEDQVKFFLK